MPLLLVPALVDAGIGEQGRHGIVVTKEFGSRFYAAVVATDLPLALDKPVDFGLQDFCEKCQICAEICLGRAITIQGEKVVYGRFKPAPSPAWVNTRGIRVKSKESSE